MRTAADESMKKVSTITGIIIIVTVAVALFGGVLGLQYYLVKNDTKTNPPNSGGNLELQNEGVFEKYTNNQLGFSIDIPKEISAVYRCSPFQNFMVHIKIFEDSRNNAAYIAPEYYYDRANKNENNLCEIKYYSTGTLREETFKDDMAWPNLNIKTYKPAIGWAIIVGNAENDENLGATIKNMFGKGCDYQQEEWKQEGVYKISFGEMNRDSLNLGNTNCPTNYDYRFLHIPSQKKIIFLKIGQDCVFFDMQTNKCYDNKMLESFLVL